MTKEEAIENIKLIRFNAAITNANSFKEALDMAIETLSQPSLPSNMDEAAEEYAYRGIPDMMKPTFKPLADEVAKYFKAGAEWMAGQGVNVDFAVCKLANRAWLTAMDEKKFTQDIFDNFAVGDKVVVQIRKK